MDYVRGFDRDQMMMATWDSTVDPDSTARLNIINLRKNAVYMSIKLLFMLKYKQGWFI